MIIGYYNLWTDILIKSLNIVANVKNCFVFFFYYFECRITNIESNRWKKMFKEGKKLFGRFICILRESFTWKKKRISWLYQEDLHKKNTKIYNLVLILQKISLFVCV